MSEPNNIPSWSPDMWPRLLPGLTAQEMEELKQAKAAVDRFGTENPEGEQALQHITTFQSTLLEKSRRAFQKINTEFEVCLQELAQSNQSPTIENFVAGTEKASQIHDKTKHLQAAWFGVGVLIEDMGLVSSSLSQIPEATYFNGLINRFDKWTLKQWQTITHGLSEDRIMALRQDPVFLPYDQPIQSAIRRASASEEEARKLTQQGNRLMQKIQSLLPQLMNQHYSDEAVDSNVLAEMVQASIESQIVKAKQFGFTDSFALSEDKNGYPIATGERAMQAVIDGKELLNAAFPHDQLLLRSVSTSPLASRISVQRATEMVVEAYARIHSEFGAIARRAFDEGWVQMRESGRFEGAMIDTPSPKTSSGSHPIAYFNFDGTLKHLMAIQHEMGHVIAHAIAGQHQPSAAVRADMAVHEIFSHLGERFLRDALLEKYPDPASQALVEDTYINRQLGTIAGAVSQKFMIDLHAQYEREGKKITSEMLEAAVDKIVTQDPDDRFVTAADILLDAGSINLLFNSLPHQSGVYPIDQLAVEHLAQAQQKDPTVFAERLRAVMSRGATIKLDEAMDALMGTQHVLEQPDFFSSAMERITNHAQALSEKIRSLPMLSRRGSESAGDNWTAGLPRATIDPPRDPLAPDGSDKGKG